LGLFFSMPQFDTYSFCSQIVWVMLCFALLYCSFTFYILPVIAANLKTRKAILSVTNTNSLNFLYSLISAHFVSVNQVFTPLQANYPSLQKFSMVFTSSVISISTVSTGWVYSLLNPNNLIGLKAYRLIWSSAIRL
jgi:hypothetical protein